MTKHWVAARPADDIDAFEFVETEVPAPARGEVTIEVRAAGMNPADYKHPRNPDQSFPIPIGYEVAGIITAIGPDTEIGSGGGAVGDEVLAYRIRGGWAEHVTVGADAVFAKPASVPFEQAANLLLAATTAAEMLEVTGVQAGETILVHGASGAVGVSVLQQAAIIGARVIGTAGEGRFDEVRRFGGEPVAYGDGLEQRVRELAPDGVAASLDCVGTDEAVDVSLAMVEDRQRIVTIAAMQRAKDDGFRVIAGAIPESQAYRDRVRGHLVDLAGDGKLEVPMARTFPLAEAKQAIELLQGQHPGGKLALIP